MRPVIVRAHEYRSSEYPRSSALTSSPVGGRARLEALQAWTRIWNGQLDEGAQVLAPDFTIWFGGEQIGPGGDRVRGPQDLADLIADFRAQRLGLTYQEVNLSVHGDTGVSLWDATRGDLHVGGIDVFTFDHGAKIRHVDSVTGQRPHHR